MHSRLMLCAFASIALLSPASPARAQSEGFGVRAGASIDPDQFYFGAHYETAPLADRIHFKPNVEVGIGDDVTLVAFNFELVYEFREGKSGWHPYAGGGPAINLFTFNDNTDAEGGLNILFGLAHRDGLFFEFKVGAIDSPDLKFGIGYTFK